MLNILWLGIIIVSVVFGILDGRTTEVANAVTNSAKLAFDIALGLTGILVFWLGLFKVAEEAGLIQIIARVIRKPMSLLFPDVPPDHPAMGAMIMNISANILGLNNAATPFGLKAMKCLDELNQHAKTASNAMCTFLAINTSSVTLIPVTAMAFLAQAGAHNPSDIIVTSILATTCSTFAGVSAARILEKLPRFAVKEEK